MRNQVPPTETKDGSATVYEHPAFGQITISRAHGSQHLYGSDFVHHSYVCIRIHQSKLHRDLAQDWYMPKDRVLEISMSEAQWATFVSAFSVGGGVPCTLNYINRQSLPGFPLRDERKEFQTDFNEIVKRATNRVRRTIDKVKEMTAGLSKTKQASIVNELECLDMDLRSNMPFVAKSFSEHIETGVEKAKIEVNAYVTSQVMKAGLGVLLKDAAIEYDEPKALPPADK